MGIIEINFGTMFTAEAMFEKALKEGNIENAFKYAKLKSTEDIQKIIDRHKFFDMFNKCGCIWIDYNTTPINSNPSILIDGTRPKGINFE